MDSLKLKSNARAHWKMRYINRNRNKRICIRGGNGGNRRERALMKSIPQDMLTYKAGTCRVFRNRNRGGAFERPSIF